jgi:Hormone-sensitive lipase (HSL) N-terminus
MDFDEIICDNLNYFRDDGELTQILKSIKKTYKKLQTFSDRVEEFCHKFDFNENSRGNGYSSYVYVSRAYISKTKELCDELKLNRQKFFFKKDKYKGKLRSFNVAIQISIKIGKCLIHNYENRKSDSLFSQIGNFDSEMTDLFNSLDHVEGYKAYYDIHVS